ncbi:MAG: hypothetical protein GTN69_01475 [Armatimonadetes bacterium]|nr:hypothetical protein [Armatimonadota bacterium]NIO74571.1 hypothetical protein [Armatimonadota bacterium]NIO97496.1 hypothetical protein [Armatimonadota bacterium]
MNPMTEAAKEITEEQTRHLDSALEHIPEERREWCAGGCAKTPMAIYRECARAYLWAAETIRGNEVNWDLLAPRVEDCPDFESAKAALEKNQSEFFAALEEIDESRLAEMVKMPWGEELSLGQYILLPSYHTCYHVGQLNYIQTLLGDAEFHF